MLGRDADWQAHTSGKVNGQNVNSAQYAYVVMSKDQMAASGVSLGDWALVTNNSTGQAPGRASRIWAQEAPPGKSLKRPQQALGSSIKITGLRSEIYL